MRLSLRGPVVLLVVVALAAGGAGPVSAADPGPARAAGQTRTTTIVQDDRSAPLTVLLVGVGAVVGVLVGLLPALVVAMLLGYVPPRLRPAGMLVEPPRAPPSSSGARYEPAAPVAPGALAAVEDPPGAEPPSPIAILAHARHQSVYDDAYAAQLERVEALRSTIGSRLRERPEPPSD